MHICSCACVMSFIWEIFCEHDCLHVGGFMYAIALLFFLLSWYIYIYILYFICYNYCFDINMLVQNSKIDRYETD